MTDTFPKYETPPVIETVLGIAFKPIQSWQIPHFGLFWEEIRHDYEKFSVQPPLPDDSIPRATGIAEITLNLGRPQYRCWFFNDAEGWLIQVQNSRFVSNWRKTPEGPYPTYSKFEERFERDWEKFHSFLRKEKLEEPQVTIAEVSYINHIDVDFNYERLGESFQLFSEMNKGSFLPPPTALSASLIYPIDENKGTLQIAVVPVVRRVDMKEVVQLTLTAKTAIASNNKDGVIAALELGHEWVVRGFTDFTTEKMHKHWGRSQ